MKQRQTHRWSGPDGNRPPLRVLIESADPALALSDFGAFTAAGIDVALCQGPDHVRAECPLVRGEACDLAAGADAILFDLGPAGTDVFEAERRSHPATPVVLRDGPPGAAVPEGCRSLPATASVEGQIDVLRAAALMARDLRP